MTRFTKAEVAVLASCIVAALLGGALYEGHVSSAVILIALLIGSAAAIGLIVGRRHKR